MSAKSMTVWGGLLVVVLGAGAGSGLGQEVAAPAAAVETPAAAQGQAMPAAKAMEEPAAERSGFNAKELRAWSMLKDSAHEGKEPTERIQAMAALGTMGNDATAAQLIGEGMRAKSSDVRSAAILAAGLTHTYDYAFGRNRDAKLLDQVIDGISHLNLSHNNPMWRYYEFNQSDRESHGLNELSDFLPSDQPDANGVVANRDIGRYEPTDQTMRFGAKHNDIFPLLGDMVRWRLGLPSRRAGSSEDAVIE